MTLKENVMKELYENPVMNGVVKVFLTTSSDTEFAAIETAAQGALNQHTSSTDVSFLAGKAMQLLIGTFGW